MKVEHFLLNFISFQTKEIHKMATAYGHLENRKRCLNFATERLEEIRVELESLSAEREMWEHIIKSQNPCTDCNGFGETYYQRSENEGNYRTCQTCGGSGEKPK